MLRCLTTINRTVLSHVTATRSVAQSCSHFSYLLPGKWNRSPWKGRNKSHVSSSSPSDNDSESPFAAAGMFPITDNNKNAPNFPSNTIVLDSNGNTLNNNSTTIRPDPVFSEAFNMTPSQIVTELDKFVIGQQDAKRSVAIAMRARWRRQKLSGPMQKEVHPANLLLMGPTGSGKTEIARRVAALSGSPFVKVEATRYTEVGVVGANADSMIKDLVEAAYKLEREKALEEVRDAARDSAANIVTGVLRAMSDEQWDLATGGKWREWAAADAEEDLLLSALAKNVLREEEGESSGVEDRVQTSDAKDAKDVKDVKGKTRGGKNKGDADVEGKTKSTSSHTTADTDSGKNDGKHKKKAAKQKKSRGLSAKNAPLDLSQMEVEILSDSSDVDEMDKLAMRLALGLGDAPIRGGSAAADRTTISFAQPDPSYLSSSSTSSEEPDMAMLAHRADRASFAQVKKWVLEGKLDEVIINIDLPVPAPKQPQGGMGPMGMGMPDGIPLGDDDAGIIMALPLFGGGGPKKKKSKPEKASVARALVALTESESDKYIDEGTLRQRAVKSAEETGIVFIDEIDKLCKTDEMRLGSGSSTNKGEGVQKELLSLIEGTLVNTPKGPVSTSHILFITSGAFYRAKPNDLLPELQGRLPIRVALQPLTEAEFRRVLVEPEYSILKQQTALMRAEQIELHFSEEGVNEIARVSALLNQNIENIGARRLTSVVAQVLNKLGFDAPDLVAKKLDAVPEAERENDSELVCVDGTWMVKVTVDAQMVNDAVKDVMKKTDLSKFTL